MQHGPPIVRMILGTFLAPSLITSSASFTADVQEPIAVSAVSFCELRFGAAGHRRTRRVEDLAADYAILPADYDVCAMAAAIQSRLADSGELIPVLDAIIAATAALAGIPRVTSDEHFRRIPTDFGLIVREY